MKGLNNARFVREKGRREREREREKKRKNITSQSLYIYARSYGRVDNDVDWLINYLFLYVLPHHHLYHSPCDKTNLKFRAPPRSRTFRLRLTPFSLSLSLAFSEVLLDFFLARHVFLSLSLVLIRWLCAPETRGDEFEAHARWSFRRLRVSGIQSRSAMFRV